MPLHRGRRKTVIGLRVSADSQRLTNRAQLARRPEETVHRSRNIIFNYGAAKNNTKYTGCTPESSTPSRAKSIWFYTP